MQTKLSVIIPVLNDTQELNATLASLIATGGDPNRYEAIVVDDGSVTPAKIFEANKRPNIHLYRNNQRRGGGAARHQAAELATGDYLLLMDAHSRFAAYWLDRALERIVGNPTTIYNGMCLGLDFGERNTLEKAAGRYCGAYLVLHNPKTNEIFEGKWLTFTPEDDEEIPCLMGACYFVPRPWFFKLGGLKGLKLWGSEEPYLALKCWLAGGNIRFLKTVEIGHKFRTAAPYHTDYSDVLYNKMRPIYELMDEETRSFLYEKLKPHEGFETAFKNINRDMNEILQDRDYYQKLLVKDLHWFCERFNIKHPLDKG